MTFYHGLILGLFLGAFCGVLAVAVVSINRETRRDERRNVIDIAVERAKAQR